MSFEVDHVKTFYDSPAHTFVVGHRHSFTRLTNGQIIGEHNDPYMIYPFNTGLFIVANIYSTIANTTRNRYFGGN